MYLPISKGSVLFFTGPLYVPILAFYFLNEPISKIDVFALILGFLGILFINNPFAETEKGENELFGAFLSCCGGVFSSIAWV